MSDSGFFSERKAAAVLKHGVLSRYVTVFAAKTGSTSTGSRVLVLDGYAGDGRYDDNSPGSPIFMTETARKFAPTRQIELHFVEKKKKRYEKLNNILEAEASDVQWKTYKGDVSEHLDTVLGRADGIPFFGFLDPCGLGLSFDDIVNKIYSRPSGRWSPGTEVLINFSAEAVRRIGGRLKESAGAKGREATLARMDAVCGNDWWRQISLNADSDEKAAEAIASEYLARLTKATGADGWVTPVKNAYHHQAKYTLIFLTRHQDGLLVFGESLSKAQEDWRKALVDPNEMLSDPVYFKANEDALANGWIKVIKQNLKAQLGVTSSFVLRSKYRDVMGSVAGVARDMHLRAAIKELYIERVTGFNGVTPTGKKIWDQTVFRA
jgi:three-Cys-motif partner protein